MGRSDCKRGRGIQGKDGAQLARQGMPGVCSLRDLIPFVIQGWGQETAEAALVPGTGRGHGEGLPGLGV